MVDRERDTDILSDEQIEKGPSSSGDMAFEDRQSGAEWMTLLRNQFPDADVDWDGLEALGADQQTVVSRVADATGMTEDAVMEGMRAGSTGREM